MENLKCFAKVHLIWDPSQEMSSSTFHQNRPHHIGQQIKALFFGGIALELMLSLWSQKKTTLGYFNTSSTWIHNSFLIWLWILKNLLSADSECPEPSLDDIITGRATDHRNLKVCKCKYFLLQSSNYKLWFFLLKCFRFCIWYKILAACTYVPGVVKRACNNLDLHKLSRYIHNTNTYTLYI